ncbi:1450_t:CDS:1, partial [Gigaspora margarita]
NLKQPKVHNKMDIDQNKKTKIALSDQSLNKESKVEDISSSIWAILARNWISPDNYKIRAKINLTLWNISTYTRAIHIKKVLGLEYGTG